MTPGFCHCCTLTSFLVGPLFRHTYRACQARAREYNSIRTDCSTFFKDHLHWLSLTNNCTQAQSGNIQKSARLPQHILHSVNLPKPQLAFLDAVDNSDGTVWKHRLKKKWHSSRSADDSINLYKSSFVFFSTIFLCLIKPRAHPYRQEISNITYPPTLFLSRPPIPPKSFESTTFTYVNTVDGLGLMLEKLRQSEEVAIDLEYHSYRSYYGFVCLMQISNREEDWVVDCLMPEVRASLEDLNEIFTNPNIIKVSLLSLLHTLYSLNAGRFYMVPNQTSLGCNKISPST